MASDSPRLTVVVVSFSGPVRLARCLESVAAATRDLACRVIVVRRARHEADALLVDETRRFPTVEFLAVPEEATVPMMRALGVRAAESPIVALIEDDCTVRPDWAKAVIAAHERPDAAIGGAVEPGVFDRTVEWSAYFCDYGRFMLPLGSGPSMSIAGNNMSFKRDALMLVLADRPQGLEEVFVVPALAQRGYATRVDPSIVVEVAGAWTSAHMTSIPFHHARAYAGQRLTTASLAERAAMSALSVALPAVKVARLSRDVLARGRYVREFALSLPWTVLLATCWSFGESTGYLFGAGRSAQRWR